MRARYITELYNLGIRRQGDNRNADELRKAISDIFSKDMNESLYKSELKENQRKAREQLNAQ